MAPKILRTTLLGIASTALVAGPLFYTDSAEARGARGFARSSVNVNRNINRNINRNVHVDVDRRGWGYDYHPIATGVAVGAAAAVTSAVIGSVVYSLPPSCSSVIVNGISYQQCGSTWYQPQYAGSNLSYTVVNPPR